MQSKIRKLLDFYKVPENAYSSTAHAVCLADTCYGSNSHEMSLSRLIASDLYITPLVNVNEDAIPLPDVQSKRVVCDTLNILISKATKPTNLAMCIPTSEIVAEILGVSIIKSDTYATADECDKILNTLLLPISENDSAFEIISNFLKEMSESDKRRKIFSWYDFSKVYLPKEFDDYGFNVSRTISEQLDVATEDTKTDFILKTFYTEVISAFTYYCYAMGKTTSLAKVGSIRVLNKILSDFDSCLHIGIAGYSSEIPPVYTPVLNNEYDRSIHGKIFSKGVLLDKTSVESVLTITKGL